MASVNKLVALRRPEETLSAELREFLDAVIIPALLEKYLAESVAENNQLASDSADVAYSPRPSLQQRHRRKV
jgi:hypothetical protein